MQQVADETLRTLEELQAECGKCVSKGPTCGRGPQNAPIGMQKNSIKELKGIAPVKA